MEHFEWLFSSSLPHGNYTRGRSVERKKRSSSQLHELLTTLLATNPAAEDKKSIQMDCDINQGGLDASLRSLLVFSLSHGASAVCFVPRSVVGTVCRQVNCQKPPSLAPSLLRLPPFRCFLLSLDLSLVTSTTELFNESLPVRKTVDTLLRYLHGTKTV